MFYDCIFNFTLFLYQKREKLGGVTFIINLCIGSVSYKLYSSPLYKIGRCNCDCFLLLFFFFNFILFSLEGTTKCSNERIIISLKRKESFKELIEEGKWLSGLEE